MNKLVVLLAFVAAALFAQGLAAQTKAPIKESLNLSLTKAQAAQVKAAQGREVTLNLTPAQAKAMRAAFPKWKGSKVTVTGEMTLREHNGKVYHQLRVHDIALQGGRRDDGQRSAPAPKQRQQGGGFDDDQIPF